MAKDGAQKLPESLWKLAFYTITWIWAIYLIATEDYFFDLQSHWNSEPLNCTCILERLLPYVYMYVHVGVGEWGEEGWGAMELELYYTCSWSATMLSTVATCMCICHTCGTAFS